MSTVSRVLRGAALCVAMVGCGRMTPGPEAPSPTAHSEWAGSLTQSWQEVGAGRYGVADRLLAEFATRHAGSVEAVDAAYWRALYKLDPANPASSAHDAIALLDTYLASGQTPHRAEAHAMRRVAIALEARPKESAPASTTGTVSQPKDDKAQSEELARLKDELAKANAELERIKRRLAQPKP